MCVCVNPLVKVPVLKWSVYKGKSIKRRAATAATRQEYDVMNID